MVRYIGMAYPNSPFWSALQDGLHIEIDGATYVLSVVDCGYLVMPFGQLVACDPFAVLEPTDNLFIAVPAGTYPVYVTLADVSGNQDGSHIREAYATLMLHDSPEVTRRIITPLPENEMASPELINNEFYGFTVDGGTACFIDSGSLPTMMPPEDTWYAGIFDTGTPDSWFSRMDDPNHIRRGLANIPLPYAINGENIILIHSGWGDGVYPIVGGYDADDNLVRVHIDFTAVFSGDDESDTPESREEP
jgi:hypothetical protein